MYLNLVGALYLNPMYTSVATPADYSAPLHTVQFFFLWFIFSSSVPAVQHHRREKDSTTLLIISSISPLACCLLLDSFRSISQFLLSWKFKVSIASLISLKSSSSKWVVGSERVPKSIWSPICLKGRSQRDPFNFSSSPFSDVTRTIYVWSTLPPVWLSVDFKGKGASDRIDGARKIYTSTHQEPTWVCYDSVAFFIRYCSNIEQKQCELLLGKCTNLFREVAPILVNIYAFISTLTQPNSFSCWWRGEVQLLPHCTETPLASPVASDSQTDLYLCLFFVFSLPSPLHPGWSLQAALFSPSRSLFGSWWDVRDVVVVMNLWPDGEKCDDSARKKEGQIVRGKCR